MTNKKPVLFGEVLYDCFEEDGSRVLGGAPFNVTWHLQGFGLDPLFISRIGEDPLGSEILSTMQQRGMQTEGLQLDPAHPTGKVSISLEDGQPTFDIRSNQAYDYIDAATIPPLNPSLIYHGSLGLRAPASAGALASLIGRYRPPVFLDVNLRPPWWERGKVLALLDHTRWLKINDDELDCLVEGTARLEDKARALQQQYDLALIIVTLGAEGAMSLDSDANLHRVKPAQTTEVVDTVGAGDAFASVCILGLVNLWPIPVMLERAQSFASLIVGQRGATLADEHVYQQLLSDWKT